MTMNDLVKIIITTEETMDETFGAWGAEARYQEAAKANSAAKNELYERFGMAVGYGGVLSKIV